MRGLGEQVVEGFKFARLHRRYFAAHDVKGKQRFGLAHAGVTKSHCINPLQVSFCEFRQ